jgi:hypothetical protein
MRSGLEARIAGEPFEEGLKFEPKRARKPAGLLSWDAPQTGHLYCLTAALSLAGLIGLREFSHASQFPR